MSFTCRPDRRLIRTAFRSNRFVLVEIVAPAAARRSTRDPINVGFVVDRSGSMGGEKIRFARQAVEQGIASLHDEDRFSIVAYDDATEIVVPSTQADAGARRDAVRRLASVDARGSTNLFEGWMRGCEQVAAHQAPGHVDRVLLLTDGLANVGVTAPDELEAHAAALGARGIRTDTFGVGRDFDERLLDRMAQAGGGQAYFIETAAQIRDFITSAVGEALDVVARDVRLEIALPPGVVCEPIGAFTMRSAGAGTTLAIDLGDLVSEQHLEVVLRLNFPYGEIGGQVPATFTLRDRMGVVAELPVELAWAYADDRENDLQPRDRAVDRAVAQRFAARVRREAIDLNRAGDYPAAAARMNAVARRIRSYAGHDAELLAIAAELQTDEARFSAPMAAMVQKREYHRSAYQLKSRDIAGRASKLDDR